ncbi:MAG TPA: hypothetical protein DGN60_02615 [Chloroflexi bacterium]|nr:hypothetical protein [Chloroflexota bacterium]|tara:strand:- start:571 stop:1263 length:693 start_codon:yes stop_codon:yes gene_type:complete
MRFSTGRCTGLVTIGNDRLQVKLDTDQIPLPGQFMLGRFWRTIYPYLNTVLFPTTTNSNNFTIEIKNEDPKSNYLNLGSQVCLIGPCGQPILINKTTRHLLLVADKNPNKLLSFAQLALSRGIDVTFFISCTYPVESLDPRIEIHRGELKPFLENHLDWAEQVLMDFNPGPTIRKLLDPISSNIYVLSSLMMPCGSGACYGCAVYTKSGWKLACKQGPFFKLSELQIEVE